MRDYTSLSRNRLIMLAKELGSLVDDVIIIGGAAAELLQTRPVLPKARPTDDVDAVVGLTSSNDYHRFSEKLRALRFKHTIGDDTHMYRWNSPSGIVFDAVPSYGFGNQWDGLAAESASDYRLDDGVTIRIVSGPVFLAMKWQAFEDRGHNDYMWSHDIEDVLAVIAGRDTIVEELVASRENVRNFVAKSAQSLLRDPNSSDFIEGALSTAPLTGEVIQLVIDRLNEIALLGVT